MCIILSEQCNALTGMLGKKYGYYIKRHKRKEGKERFFSQRSKHRVPPDGHWRFIVACAQMARNGVYISDVRATRKEIREALVEANHYLAAQNLRLDIYTARDIINLQKTFGL